jgi:GNAT superfamily N-acetyltransferase
MDGHKRTGPATQAYTTRELTPKTWSDFVHLFSQRNGWDSCWCMHFHRCRVSPEDKRLRTRAEKGAQNRRDKKERVEDGSTQGVLVYAEGQPVGWCQFGPAEHFPRIEESPCYRGCAPEISSKRLWRITCFVVDKRHRRRGIAGVALQAALAAIRKRGGGLVEAYPLRPWEDVCRAELRRRGRAPAFGNVSTHGTASRFEKAGFKPVSLFGPLNVLMRRTV